MTVKQYLYSVRDEQKEIEELNERIYEMRMSLLPGAMRYDTDKVQVSPKDTTDRMAEIADYVTSLENKMETLAVKRRNAQKLIWMLEDSRERQVLDSYFLSVKRPAMRNVAAMINYSLPQTVRIYDSGIKHLEKMITNDNEVRAMIVA